MEETNDIFEFDCLKDNSKPKLPREQLSKKKISELFIKATIPDPVNPDGRKMPEKDRIEREWRILYKYVDEKKAYKVIAEEEGIHYNYVWKILRDFEKREGVRFIGRRSRSKTAIVLTPRMIEILSKFSNKYARANFSTTE